MCIYILFYFISFTVAEYRGHVNLTYYVKSCLSPCGSYLLSGSSDNHAYIWLTEKPGRPIARLTGHFAEVTSVGWCPVDDEKVGTLTLHIVGKRFALVIFMYVNMLNI